MKDLGQLQRGTIRMRKPLPFWHRARWMLRLLVMLLPLAGIGCIRYQIGDTSELNGIALLAAGALGSASLTQPDCVCVTEGGVTDSYTITLQNQPSSDVTVTVTPDAQLMANNSSAPSTLVFTSANFDRPQTVTVKPIDDTIAEGTHFASIGNAITVGDPDFAGRDLGTIAVTITDNDTAGVSVDPLGTVNVTEGAGNDTYTVVLTSQPAADVVIGVSPDSQSTTNTPSLTFTASNWNVAQTVTVAAVNDLVAEGAHTSTISHTATSADTSYNGAPVTGISAAITDNDSAGISVTEPGGTSVTEGGATDTYTIVLTSQPTAGVTVNISTDSQVTENQAGSVSFTTGNWNIAQTVTVTAVNDLVAEGAHGSTVTHSAASADGFYNGVAVNSVSVSITDNDSAGVSINDGGSTNVTEGGATDTYTIVLTSQPTAGVTVNISTDSQVTENQAGSVSFTTGNWNIAQTVTVTAVNDLVAEGAHASTITHSVTGGDPTYNALTPNAVGVTIADNDFVGYTVSTISRPTSESGTTATFTVRLQSEPTGSVVIGVSSGTPTEGSVNPASLTFTAGDWNSNQTVTVTGVEDAGAVDGDIAYTIVLATPTGADVSGYLGANPPDVSAVNWDNDSYHIFRSDVRFGGDLGGTAGADAKCDARAAALGYPGTYKAIIGNNTVPPNRIACGNANCGTPHVDDNTDWVLKANSRYYRAEDGALIGTTTADRIFTFPLSAGFSSVDTSGVYGWSGIAGNWRVGPRTCDGWSNSGTIGDLSHPWEISSNVLGPGTGQNCSVTYWISCAQQ